MSNIILAERSRNIETQVALGGAHPAGGRWNDAATVVHSTGAERATERHRRHTQEIWIHGMQRARQSSSRFSQPVSSCSNRKMWMRISGGSLLTVKKEFYIVCSVWPFPQSAEMSYSPHIREPSAAPARRHLHCLLTWAGLEPRAIEQSICRISIYLMNVIERVPLTVQDKNLSNYLAQRCCPKRATSERKEEATESTESSGRQRKRFFSRLKCFRGITSADVSPPVSQGAKFGSLRYNFSLVKFTVCARKPAESDAVVLRT